MTSTGITPNVTGIGPLDKPAIDGSRRPKIRRPRERNEPITTDTSWICPACGRTTTNAADQARHVAAELNEANKRRHLISERTREALAELKAAGVRLGAPQQLPRPHLGSGSRVWWSVVSRPWMVDGFCGVGGATRGWQLAGFRVLGVDIEPQPDYCGDDFVQGDAVDFLRRRGRSFVAAHVSPPCQHDCTLTAGTNAGRFTYPDLLDPTRAALEAAGVPFVIEQPPGRASKRMRVDVTLCGEMFGLGVIRHRNFELSGFAMPRPVHKPHRGRVAGMRHGEWFTGPYFAVYGEGGGKGSVEQWRQAMGIDWTSSRRSLAEAIPPAYSELIGVELRRALECAA